jgi:hypothetical protein
LTRILAVGLKTGWGEKIAQNQESCFGNPSHLDHARSLRQLKFAAFIGIDWADRKHDVCLQVAGSDTFEKSVIEHRPTVIDAWALNLCKRFDGRPVAVCLELAQSPIVSALLEYDFFVIFPVNPSTLAQYRKAFTPSGAKDDPTDAAVALEILRRHPDKLAPLRRESVDMRALRRLVESRRDLVQDRVRVTNRLIYALKAYFPQILDWFRDKETGVFAAFIERWPSLPEAQRAKRDTLIDFFHANNVRRANTIEKRIAAIKSEKLLTTDPAVIEPALLSSLLCWSWKHCCRNSAHCRSASSDSTRRSHVAARCFRTIAYSPTCPALEKSSHLGSSLPLANNATDSPPPRLFRSSQGSRQLPSVVARATGSTGAGPAPNSFVRPSSNGPPAPFPSPSGLGPSMRATGHRDPPTTPPFAPLHSSGFEFSFAAGSTASPTRNLATSPRSRNAIPQSSDSPHKHLHNLLAVRLRARVRRPDRSHFRQQLHRILSH